MSAYTLAPSSLARPTAPHGKSSPTITVVVASSHSKEQLERCLASLLPQCQRAAAEVIVVRSGTVGEMLELRAAMPAVHFITAAPSATVAQLRALGMTESDGDIVAFTEDDCVPDASWVDALLGHGHELSDVIGRLARTAQRDRSGEWPGYFARNGVLK